MTDKAHISKYRALARISHQLPAADADPHAETKAGEKKCGLVAIILLGFVLGGCGQKGDLYLPDTRQEDSTGGNRQAR